MKILFGVYGYSSGSEPLQPWLTICRVAEHMLARGWDVHVMTDDPAGDSGLPDLTVHVVDGMRPSNRDQVLGLVERLDPDRVILLSNPMNLAVAGWFPEVRARLYAYLSYPFYTRAEIFRALPFLNRQDIKTYGRHMLVPEFLWGRILARFFKGVIGQSQRTTGRVAGVAGDRTGRYPVPAGINLDFWKPAEQERPGDRPLRYLYLGSARRIRGFELTLKAFRAVACADVELRILARSATDLAQREIDETVLRCMDGDLSRVSMEGGWLTPEALREEIRQADVVVLPFVLVPSELPVSVMECVACGTPVITTDIDGLPEAVGEGGWVVRSASLAALTKALKECRDSADTLQTKKKGCLEQRSRMLSWEAVAERWMEVLG